MSFSNLPLLGRLLLSPPPIFCTFMKLRMLDAGTTSNWSLLPKTNPWWLDWPTSSDLFQRSFRNADRPKKRQAFESYVSDESKTRPSKIYAIRTEKHFRSSHKTSKLMLRCKQKPCPFSQSRHQNPWLSQESAGATSKEVRFPSCAFAFTKDFQKIKGLRREPEKENPTKIASEPQCKNKE